AQPWFPFLERHHYIHHVDTEANVNFLLPLADWLFGTLRCSLTAEELARHGSLAEARAPPRGMSVPSRGGGRPRGFRTTAEKGGSRHENRAGRPQAGGQREAEGPAQESGARPPWPAHDVPAGAGGAVETRQVPRLDPVGPGPGRAAGGRDPDQGEGPRV